jgi:hypothetical protein
MQETVLYCESVNVGDFVGSENGTESEFFWIFKGFFDCEGFVNGFNLSSRYVEPDAGADDFAAAYRAFAGKVR